MPLVKQRGQWQRGAHESLPQTAWIRGAAGATLWRLSHRRTNLLMNNKRALCSALCDPLVFGWRTESISVLMLKCVQLILLSWSLLAVEVEHSAPDKGLYEDVWTFITGAVKNIKFLWRILKSELLHKPTVLESQGHVFAVINSSQLQMPFEDLTKLDVINLHLYFKPSPWLFSFYEKNLHIILISSLLHCSLLQSVCAPAATNTASYVSIHQIF